jgi:hypothetical protein
VKICRKESKESRLFLRLVDAGLAKSNVAARETLAADARIDPDFFIDYLEEPMIALPF